MINVEKYAEIVQRIKKCSPVFWNNDKVLADPSEYLKNQRLQYKDILDAEDRWKRFSPLIKSLFPEIKEGIIESDIKYADKLKHFLEKKYKQEIVGDILLKCDNNLPITGSIKSRGGIYEVLTYAEKLAIEEMGFSENDYSTLAEERYKELFSSYKILVGSTGNLGLGVGIMAKRLGFQVQIHMSIDAKKWKKDLLKNNGAEVVEHSASYSEAVKEGREAAVNDPKSYFVDDENSEILFLGYATAVLRLKKQLEEKGIVIDSNNPLYVYLPCGVGGAPGGITFALKHLFDKNVKSYFAEPVKAPAVFLGVLTEKCQGIDVRDYDIDGKTIADGLAVVKPSKLSCEMMKYLVDGFYTVDDKTLAHLSIIIKDIENEKIEPSAAAGIVGPFHISERSLIKENVTHLVWLTGGSIIPDDVYNDMLREWNTM
ncbi:MAG: D-serine ammonia-lyase [Petrotogales bacterium]